MLQSVWCLFFVSVLWQSAYSKPSGPSDECGECCNIDFENCDVKDPNPKDKWIVCHFTGWASDRKGKAKFTPEDIDPSLCTHINYAFALLDSKTLTIVSGNKKSDEVAGFYKKVTGHKAKGVTVMLSIGGWDDSGDGDKWTRMIRSESARSNFVESILKMLEKYNFDGLDMGFSFPACPQGKAEAGLPTDKENYNQLLSELKTAFNGKYFLSVQVSAKKSNIDDCYDMSEVCNVADWINLMTYEYHSHWQGKTGAQSPICGSPDVFGVYDTVKYYLNKVQCPANKMILGVNFFAGTYTLKDKSKPEFGVDVTGPGERGPLMNFLGYFSYYEVCLFAKQGWQVGSSKMNGEYIWKDDQFATVPSVKDMKRKSCLAKHFNLKGMNLWTMDYDDFNNQCGCGNWPLLTTLNNQLRGTHNDISCLP